MNAAVQLNLRPEVESFLGQSPFPSFVGGEHFPNDKGRLIATCDPGSGEKIADIQQAMEQCCQRTQNFPNHLSP